MKNASPKNRTGVKRVAVFIVCALLIQLVFILFLTPEGLSHVFPLAVRMNSEKITFDNSFAEYYDLRSDFADRDLYFLGVDTNVADTYPVIIDYLRFVKKAFDVDSVMLPISRNTAKALNEVIASADGDEYDGAIEKLKSSGAFSDQFISFARDLRSVNNTLTPKRKLTVIGGSFESFAGSYSSKMMNFVLNKWTKDYSDTIYNIITINDADEFFDYLKSNETEFRSFLGESEYEYYMTLDSHRLAGDYGEWRFSQKLADRAENRILCVVPNDILTDKLDPYLTRLGRNWCKTQILYSDSETIDNKRDSAEAWGVDVPFTSEGTTRFVSASGMESFRSFYRKIANPFGKTEKEEVASFFDKYTTPYFFVVCGSKAVTYGANEAQDQKGAK